MLWNRNFTSLAAANVFFHAAVYMQFPLLHRWMTEVWGYTGVEAACMAVVFGLSLFVPGVFNSYLVDTFSRKRVCVWSMIVLGLATVAYTGVSSSWQILVLRILQGGAFGIALMSTGSTLAIDVASSHQRDRANRAFTWSGIVGMLVGILIGLTSVPHRGFQLFGCVVGSGYRAYRKREGLFPCPVGFALVLVRPFPAFPSHSSGR